MSNLNWAKRPSRRSYSSKFKTQIVEECRQPGASVAGVGLSHGVNANILHRWIREHSRKVPVAQSQAFVPVRINEVTAASLVGASPGPRPDIRIEVSRGQSTVVVNWPLEAASSCAAWLRDWLK